MKQGCKGQAVPGTQKPPQSVRVGLLTHLPAFSRLTSLVWGWPLWLYQQRRNTKDATCSLWITAERQTNSIPAFPWNLPHALRLWQPDCAISGRSLFFAPHSRFLQGGSPGAGPRGQLCDAAVLQLQQILILYTWIDVGSLFRLSCDGKWDHSPGTEPRCQVLGFVWPGSEHRQRKQHMCTAPKTDVPVMSPSVNGRSVSEWAVGIHRNHKWT